MSISEEDTARIYAAVNAEKGCTIEDIEKLYDDAMKMIDDRRGAAMRKKIEKGHIF